MPKLRLLAALAAATAALGATPALAAPVTVNLRIEGSTQTLYEGPISTDAKTLTKDASGSHPCDGTNGGVNPSPGATATGAMDDAANAAGFTWDATWDAGFQDFFINRIGPDTNASSPPYTYWGVFVNGVLSNVGGCQQRVNQGDDVLWAYANYGDPLLVLSGTPQRAETGQQFTVSVAQNDGNGQLTPAAGATVDGQTTDSTGHATIAFADAGNHTFKATRSGSVRSNARTVCVYVPGSGDCGTQTTSAPAGNDQSQQQDASGDPSAQQPTLQPAVKDTTPPVAHITTIADGKTYGRGPRVLAGDVDDAGGIAQVFLRLRATDGGDLTSASRCRWFSGTRGVFTHRSVPCSRARFFRIGTDRHFSYLLPARLRRGHYVFEVKVLDRAYNAGRSSAAFKVR